MFYSRSFIIVSGLTFRFLIHFKLIFVYGVRKCSNLILSHVAVQFFPIIYLRDSFPHCIFLSQDKDALDKHKTKETCYEISSVAQSCLTLRNPMDCSMPGLPVHHQLPESTQIHVH